MNLAQDLLPHMRRVQAADRELHDLSLIWTMIEATSAISCPEEVESILPTLVQTREAFTELHSRLVQQLGLEHLHALRDELLSTAQCTIDILVRNLFERTADVGFLATDGELRAFCSAAAEERSARRMALQRRLDEYREKYTVYDDILVLSPSGDVLARLDDEQGLRSTRDAIVERSVRTDGYVQRFALTDLAPGDRPALLYGHRIENAQGRCVGVLVLRFRLSDEMERIFASVNLPDRSLAVTLVDDGGHVVVSNDETHVPVGSRMQESSGQDIALTHFAGREYLSVTCRARGYQGYAGLGWRAVVMVSLVTAFQQRADTVELIPGVALNSAELQRVQSDVDAINRNLRRVVWNGRISASQQQGSALRLKAVLQQINRAGERMRDRVGRAIQDLRGASLGRAQRQAAGLARLAVDILDRNFYERANDCRWWALSPVMQQALTEAPNAAGDEALRVLLAHINSLYTVYTRLVAFDAQGLIRAVSRDAEAESLVGRAIDADLLAATLELRDSQSYAVSSFAGSALSDGVPGFTYLAAVRCPQTHRLLGGIAIVFNAAKELRDILDDVLAGREGMASFVGGDGRVIASTDAAQALGRALNVDIQQSEVEYQATVWTLSKAKASGYREFNTGVGYRHGIAVVVALRLGAVEQRRAHLYDRGVLAEPCAARDKTRELAVFQVGPERYALPTSSVMRAHEIHNLVRLPLGAAPAIGMLDVGVPGRPCVVPVLCARQLMGVKYVARESDGVVVVITQGTQDDRAMCGLRVDDLISVLDVPETSIQPVPAGLRTSSPLLDSVVRVQAERGGPDTILLQLLRPLVLAALGKPAAQQTECPVPC